MRTPSSCCLRSSATVPPVESAAVRPHAFAASLSLSRSPPLLLALFLSLLLALSVPLLLALSLPLLLLLLVVLGCVSVFRVSSPPVSLLWIACCVFLLLLLHVPLLHATLRAAAAMRAVAPRKRDETPRKRRREGQAEERACRRDGVQEETRSHTWKCCIGHSRKKENSSSSLTSSSLPRSSLTSSSLISSSLSSSGTGVVCDDSRVSYAS